jgi:hypothetical protein
MEGRSYQEDFERLVEDIVYIPSTLLNPEAHYGFRGNIDSKIAETMAFHWMSKYRDLSNRIVNLVDSFKSDFPKGEE